MDDSTGREDEKVVEQAREQGRREELERQREQELAMEKGRRMGLEEERERQKRKGGGGSGVKIAALFIALLIIIAIIAYMTLSVSVTAVSPGGPLPYMTMYGVSFPEGQAITVGDSAITVLSYQNELISDIDGDREKLVIGEGRVTGERRAVITTFGSVRLMDSDFLMNLTYKGERDNRAYFDMAVYTSRQVPDILLRLLLPREIDARPI